MLWEGPAAAPPNKPSKSIMSWEELGNAIFVVVIAFAFADVVFVFGGQVRLFVCLPVKLSYTDTHQTHANADGRKRGARIKHLALTDFATGIAEATRKLT